MIAKSDVVILLVSASALAAGIYRWQHNMASLAPVPAVVQRVQSSEPVIANSATGIATQNPQVIGAAAVPRNGANVQPGTQTTANTTTSSVTVEAANGIPANNTQTQTTASVNAAGNGETNGNTASANNSASGSQPLYGVYVVESGDFLGKIAEEFGTTVDTLRSINQIEGSLIDIGQEIRYPLPAN